MLIGGYPMIFLLLNLSTNTKHYEAVWFMRINFS